MRWNARACQSPDRFSISEIDLGNETEVFQFSSENVLSGDPQALEKRNLDEIQEHRKCNCADQRTRDDYGRKWRHGDSRDGQGGCNQHIADG